MSIDKNFVVKHGLEVNSDLILADSNTKRVGIATTVPGYTLDVAGGIGVTNLSVTGIGSIVDLHVGNGGEVFRAIGAAGSVGVGTAFPSYLLDVRTQSDSGTTALYVRGDVQVTGDLNIDDISVNQSTFDHIYVGTSATTVNLYVPNAGIATIGVGIITTLNGTHIDYAGVGTIATFNSTRSTITNLVGTSSTLTNLVSTSSTISDLKATSSTITNLLSTSSTSTFAKITGISTIGDLVVSGLTTSNNLEVVGFTTLSNVSITGISTIGDLVVSGVTDFNNLQVVGFTTLSNVSITGISTIGDLVVSGLTTSNNLEVVGFTTLSNVSITGNLGVTNASFTNLSGTISTISNLDLTGISTFSSTILVGTSSSTGSGDQLLQVNSGAYFSSNVGIGSTIPEYKLVVDGDINATGNIRIGGVPIVGISSVALATTAFGLKNSPDISVGVITSKNLNSSGIITATGGARLGNEVFIRSSGIYVNSGIVTSPIFKSGDITIGPEEIILSKITGNVAINSTGINASGIITASNIVGTTSIIAGSNVISNATGVNVSSGILTAPTVVVGSSVTANSSGINVSGIVTATEFRGRSGFSVAMSLIFGY